MSAQEDGDLNKLEILIEMKERRCEKLQNELEKEQERGDKIKAQRMKQIEEKFKKLKKTESSLSRSLASSRNSTPAVSPKEKGAIPRGVAAKPVKKPDRKKQVISKKSSGRGGASPKQSPRTARGELFSNSLPRSATRDKSEQ